VEKDPYVGDMEETVKGVLNKIGIFPWHIAFQSKGSGTEEWLGPDVESVLKEISSQSIHGVLIVPVGFVADHVEVLYDIDILYREEAESLGIVLRRTSSLNSSERFIEALASIVEEHMEGLNGSGGRGPR
jgi:ferrochelatase